MGFGVFFLSWKPLVSIIFRSQCYLCSRHLKITLHLPHLAFLLPALQTLYIACMNSHCKVKVTQARWRNGAYRLGSIYRLQKEIPCQYRLTHEARTKLKFLCLRITYTDQLKYILLLQYPNTMEKTKYTANMVDHTMNILVCATYQKRSGITEGKYLRESTNMGRSSVGDSHREYSQSST